MSNRTAGAIIVAMLSLSVAHAQSTSVSKSVPDGAYIADGLALRVETAELVRLGAETPTQALTRLKAKPTLTGFNIDKDADFAWTVMDIGHRLTAIGKSTEATEFFRAADEALGKAIDKAKDSAAQEKVMYLKQRALIRGQFLNRPVEAGADLDAAQKLLPDDKDVKRTLDVLARDKAEQFKGKIQPNKG